MIEFNIGSFGAYVVWRELFVLWLCLSSRVNAYDI